MRSMIRCVAYAVFPRIAGRIGRIEHSDIRERYAFANALAALDLELYMPFLRRSAWRPETAVCRALERGFRPIDPLCLVDRRFAIRDREAGAPQRQRDPREQ